MHKTQGKDWTYEVSPQATLERPKPSSAAESREAPTATSVHSASQGRITHNSYKGEGLAAQRLSTVAEQMYGSLCVCVCVCVRVCVCVCASAASLPLPSKFFHR